MVFMVSQPAAGKRTPFDLLRTPHLATVTVILLAYAIVFVEYVLSANSPGGADFPAATLLVATLLGILYLYLLVREDPLFEVVLYGYAKTVHFILLTALMMTIQFLLDGSNGIWLISMPLVAMATTELRPPARWLVYLAALISLAGPIYLATGSLNATLTATLTFSTAIVFVAVFAQLTEKAENAQAEAEALTHQLEEANQQLSDYAVQAEELATTQERNRLAREIHDNLGHYLTVVNVQIKAALAIMDADPAAARATLTKARQQTEDGLTAIRQSVAALRESPLGEQTLADAIAELVDDAQSAGLLVSYVVRGTPRLLSPTQELTLFRAAQEALTNVRRHAAASRVDLLLDYDDMAAVRLSVIDNGIGVDMARHKVGFGLIGLRERVHQLNGDFSFSGRPGEGFAVAVTLPTTTPEGAAALAEPTAETAHG